MEELMKHRRCAALARGQGSLNLKLFIGEVKNILFQSFNKHLFSALDLGFFFSKLRGTENESS
jgi:hypothetical protein